MEKMKPIEILRLAIEREKQSYKFYMQAAGDADHPATKSTLIELAEEEKSHITRLEDHLDKYFYTDN